MYISVVGSVYAFMKIILFTLLAIQIFAHESVKVSSDREINLLERPDYYKEICLALLNDNVI